ncbi:fatty acid synthase-like [Hetaerina americana]|uniref:fatty acid synthase-like n=1 Tax=Hetaerina americana TaxID=62018 RepID=UPI003A7F5D55
MDTNFFLKGLLGGVPITGYGRVLETKKVIADIMSSSMPFEVVVSGMAGKFPESEDLCQLRDQLFDKVDLVTDDDRRWKLDHPEIPQRTGKLKNLTKFDASFFGVHYKQAHTMDPMCRILLELAYEAVVDAGVNPSTLRNTKTGVFIGACFSESEKTWFYERIQINGFGITGCSRAMLANRISYWLGITGPSYCVDTACSSSMYALEHAYRAIQDGRCDAALVGGCNLTLHPYISMQFSRLGVLSADGRCKSFDEKADGYCRSETIAMIFLQKSTNARRIYATVVHAKTNCDGYKEQGITYPSGRIQRQLLQEFYNECNVNPGSLGYLEAHGTGTKVGDPEELNAIDEVFCKPRDSATLGPLLVGSVKSNLGHSEAASALCSVVKVLFAMETGYIPPNLHFHDQRKGIPALADNRVKVVTEKMKWSGGLAGVNSFGFGGANSHVLFRWNEKIKLPPLTGEDGDAVPRLVLASGRTEEAVNRILSEVESMRAVDPELVALLHEIHASNIPGHIYRGHTLLQPRPEGSNNAEEKITRDIQYYPGARRPLWFVFSGMGSQWAGMGKDLLRLPVFAAAIASCDAVLKPRGLDIYRIISDPDPKIFDDILNSFVGIAAVQIGIVDALVAAGVCPDGVVGHSVGELGCAYADGCLTAQQMILAAYSRGLASIETPLIIGSMAAVGLSQTQVRELLPPELDVACHNGTDSCTVSGPAAQVATFVENLRLRGIFAREVKCSNIAYHSRYIANAGPTLLKYLKQVIPESKARSPLWISSSVPESQWGEPQASFSSAEYHTNNLLCPVLFEEATTRHIPRDAITIEIAPHALLQPVLRRSLPSSCAHVPLTSRGHPNNLEVFLGALGKLYQLGAQPRPAGLYPKCEFPVGRGTPMISPLVRWEHSDDWFVTEYKMEEKITSGERAVAINLAEEEDEFYAGHVIDGRNLFPATGYLAIVWETLGMMKGKLYTELPVVFENVRFLRATNIPKEGTLLFNVMIMKGSGDFEVVEGGVATVSGRIYVTEDVDSEFSPAHVEEGTNQGIENNNEREFNIPLSSADVYKELRLRGYNYTGYFCGISHLDQSGKTGHLEWINNWATFLDTMLQVQILQKDTRALYVPTSIEKLIIDPKKHTALVNSIAGEEKSLPVRVRPSAGIIESGGVEFRRLKASVIQRRRPTAAPVLEEYSFVPYLDPAAVKKEEKERDEMAIALRICVHLVAENISISKLRLVEETPQNPTTLPNSAESQSSPWTPTVLLPSIADILSDLPLVQADMTVLASSSTATSLPMDELGARNIRVEERQLSGVSGMGSTNAGSNSKQQQQQQGATNYHLTVASDLLLPPGRRHVLGAVVSGLQDGSFLLVRERPATWEGIQGVETSKEQAQQKRVYLVSQRQTLTGMIGLFNCLRREPGGENARCVIIDDPEAPDFAPSHPLYAPQLSLDLAVNILQQGGIWGSMRHLPIIDAADCTDPVLSGVPVQHAYANLLTRGDLSSIRWFESPIGKSSSVGSAEEICEVYYAALNFRDVMTATGKLAVEVVCPHRLKQECVQGLEFSGRASNGRRVMGMVPSGALATAVKADKYLMWNVPPEWTLEEAATVPVVYSTAYYALVLRGGLQGGESVLVHAGSGGVGQAAISIALHAGCIVYTTVGTPEKKAFLLSRFPQLKANHIGHSRDTSFEQKVLQQTKGRGVDLILNSLAGEKLRASVRCLAPHGRFLEIGKFDLANDNPLGMEVFLKDTAFHGVMLDLLFEAPPEDKFQIHHIVEEGIASGAVRPLPRTTFNHQQVEQAFRYMASGKHIGKVLIQVRDEEKGWSGRGPAVPQPVDIKALPRFYCDPDMSYVIIGGLGGVGLELADWLVTRGCKKLLLSSRQGVHNGYQSFRLGLWQSEGVNVIVSKANVASPEGCECLLKEAVSLGPVDAIFNLAAVLTDSLLENQTEEAFWEAWKPKAQALDCLDKASRVHCSKLSHFVAFSSVSCGRGHGGQTTYGLANSTMEAICRARRKVGLPALAVQWGAVGDVGLVAEAGAAEVVVGGTLQQKLVCCLSTLDFFLCRESHTHPDKTSPVVTSMVVAEKGARGSRSNSGVVDTVADILGIRDLKTVSPNSTLAELGMDSMMAVEIKQTLEREFELFLTPQDVRSLSFARLAELSSSLSHQPTVQSVAPGNEEGQNEVQSIDGLGFDFLQRVLGEELTDIAPLLVLQSLSPLEGAGILPVFMLPGIEGMGAVLEPLAREMRYPVVSLQMGNDAPTSSIPDMASYLIKNMRKMHDMNDTRRPYNFVGYSFGAVLALEMVSQLEEEMQENSNLKRSISLVLIDGSTDYLQQLVRATLLEKKNTENEEKEYLPVTQIQQGEKEALTLLQSNLLCHIFNYLPTGLDMKELHQQLMKLKDWQTRCKHAVSLMPKSVGHSPEFLLSTMSAVYSRIMALINYTPRGKRNTQVTLIRTKHSSIQLDEDYGLGKYFKQKISIQYVDGNHITILEKKMTANILNEEVAA